MARKPIDRYPVEPFDRVAQSYDALVSSAEDFPFAGYDEVLDEAVRRAEACSGMSVLDLGIGTGGLAQRFDSFGCNIWGVDFSAKMLEEAKGKLPRAVLRQADIMADWPTEFQRRFDRVVSSYALHHFTLAEKCGLLKRISERFLKQEGRIVVADVSFPTGIERRKAHEALGKEWEDNEYYWACDETTSALANVGLHLQYTQVSVYGGVYDIAMKRV